MRPLVLELEGFLSYKEKTVVDFSDLSLFAITGMTGAGKTTIIDAITFALYGKCPRFEKGASKEDYISKGKDFFRVSLTFSLNDKTYTVGRYLKSGKNIVVSLKENGKEIITEEKNKLREERIKEILNMDYDTFTKVIVLPQGEFAKFIKPESPQERREIIMRLSNLDKIDKMRELAASQKKDLKNEIDSISLTIDNLKSNQENVEELQKKLDSLEQELSVKTSEKKVLLERFEKAKKKQELKNELSKLMIEYENLENQKEKMELIKKRIEFLKPKLSLKSDIERYIKLKNELEKTTLELDKKNKEYFLKEQEYNKLLINFETIKADYEQTKYQEERVERGYKIISILENALSIESYITNDEARIRDLEQQLKTKKEEKSKLLAEIEHYENLSKEENKEAIEKDIENLTAIISQLELKEKEKDKKLLEQKKLMEEVDNINKELLKYKEEQRNLDQELNANKNNIVLYYSNMLKTLLKENDICPVCGGVYHEKEHTTMLDIEVEEDIIKNIEDIKSKIALSEDRLKSKKEALEKLSEEIESLEKELLEKETLQSRLKELKQRREFQDNIQKNLEKLKSKKDKLENEILLLNKQKEGLEKDLYNKKESLKTLEKELLSYGVKEGHLQNKKNAIDQYKNKLDEIRNEIQNKRKIYEDTKEMINTYEKSIMLLKEQVSSLSVKKSTISEELNELETKLSSIEDKEKVLEELNRLENYERTYNEYMVKLSNLKEQIQLKENEIVNITEEAPPQELENMLEVLEEYVKTLNQEIGSISSKINQAKENEKQIKELEETIKDLEKKYNIYERLEQDLKSDALQAYISQKIIEELVKYANVYASKMEFPYLFKVEEKSREKDSIVVEDAFGNTRPIKSLSGGETFITSLCFALALSEAVGSKHLKSLFIDEGFGTLDKETLEKVGNALELLSQNINKMVGIITHVESLAEKFPNRLIVTKTKDGSSKIEVA
ncbi:SMC domain protein [Hydrogenobaculum sp. Y04AAS1]|uniref:AAA family ATPase n=1 Tax=Hydrogenobaculum sp. (strain Y04AAS1) TaxID=380749 RepID=UPI00017BBD76|nr:SMC domain protein [Hydrogenobaculum sp. Y04AAS1]HCT66767.1 chromosome segregation protein SMC [Hydrogenobaculum sp.]